MKNIWDKWGAKTFNNTGEMIKFVTSEKNWNEFKANFPSEIVSKFQNTLASHIIRISENNDGSINFGKLQNNIEQFSSNLTSSQKNALSELHYTSSLPQTVANNPQVSADLQNILGLKNEKTLAEQGIQTTEGKIDQLKANMKVVGTTPEQIATNLKSIQTMDDLGQFMKAAGITDPKQLGEIIKGTLFDQMQQQFGSNKGIDFVGLTELVRRTRDIGKESPLGQQLKDSLFSKEDQSALEKMETDTQDLMKLFNKEGVTPALKRTFHALLSAGAATLGWHVTAARNFFEAIKPNSVTHETPMTEAGLRSMADEKISKSKGSLSKTANIISKRTPGAEGLQNIQQYLKAAEHIMGRPATDEEEAQLIAQWKENNQ